jgi:uncharacterized membrane protein YkvA (DUF1232 family)
VNSSPAHWYPTVSRVEEIQKEIEDFEKLSSHQAAHVAEIIPDISQSLKNAHNFPGFPRHQIRLWIWVASQFRIHASDLPEVARIAGSALNFMVRFVGEKSKLSFGDIQELSWVLGTTTEKLTAILGPTTLRSYLSSEELIDVERLLEYFKTLPVISAEEHRSLVEEQVGEIRALSNKGFLATLCTKVDALLDAVRMLEGEKAAVAGAALRYLAEEEDVVPDSIGFLGLVDDIYVIEWAYSFIEGHTNWLPFFEEMLEQWPFVDDLVFGEGRQKRKLDRWSRYVVCAALASHFSGKTNNLLILRETGPFGLLAALAIALQIQRYRSAQSDDQAPWFEIDQPIFIGDETEQFKAIFGGPCEFAGPDTFWLKVSDDARITISAGAMAASHPSPEKHKKLSTGNEISEWLRDRHPDPLTHLAGTGASPGRHQGVLLLTMKKRMEEYLPLVRPLGVTVPSLFGMRYITTTNKSIDLQGSATDQPIIYACSDPTVALDLVKNRPDHISEWLVVADGAKLARTIQASLASSGEFADTRLCALAELHDREACRDIARAGLKPWYLQDLDVEVPPMTPENSGNSNSSLDRFFIRQHMHWSSTRSEHLVEQSFYEDLAFIFHELRTHLRKQETGGDPSLEILGMNVSTFIRKSLEYPLDPTPEMRSELKVLASRIFSYSSALRAFSEPAELICEHFREAHTREVPVCNREAKLIELVESALQNGEKEIAVLCRSNHIAAKCEAATLSHPILSQVKWVNLDALRRISPVDRLVVPGWIDRITMRDLGNNGYGVFVDLILLPFEAEMFKSGLSAGLRWESQLSENNSVRYSQLRTAGGSNGNNQQGLWKTNRIPETGAAVPDEMENAVLEPIEEEGFDFEYLETQVAEAIKNQTDRTSLSGETVSATLVLFEEAGAYAYLPPNGRVIALSDVVDEIGFAEGSSAEDIGSNKAENLLFRPVSKLHPGLLLAFPLEGDRDLVDARADQFLENAEQTRRVSSLWKAALCRHFETTGESYAAFSRKMEEAGEPREASTIRLWATKSQSIAPRNFTITVPLISKLTEDEEMRGHLQQILDDIQKIYDARAEAASTIVREIFSGDLNLEAELLTVDIDETTFTYQLQRVAAVKETREIPTEWVGGVNKLGGGDVVDRPQPE